MIENVDIPKTLRLSLRNGGEFADIFWEYNNSTSILCEEDRIEPPTVGVDFGVGIRVIFDEKTSYAYSNESSDLVSLATAVSKLPQGGSFGKEISLEKQKARVNFEIKISPQEIPISKKIEMVKRANKTARGFDKRIRQVRITYGDKRQKVTIANSEGILAEDERWGIIFTVQVVAEADGVIQTGYEAVGGFLGLELFEENPPEEIAKVASRRAILMLEARRIKGGRMPVVIEAAAGGTMIHEAIGHGLEADLAQEGLSVYSRLKGEQVASPLITVNDDATLPQKRGSFSFDDEGTPSQRTVLVEKGVLKGYLYDRLTALKEGVSSTGNGRREYYHHKPIPRMTNTFIAPGESTPGEIIRSTWSGLLVRKMGGGQVNTVIGDFVFEVSEGYLIEGGKVGKAVRDTTLVGNGPEILKQIDMVGNDLGFGIGTCGKDGQGVPVADAQPTLRIPEIIVGGAT